MKKSSIAAYCICLLLVGAPLVAEPSGPGGFDSAGQVRFLPVDQAFQLNASWEDNALSVRWYVRPGYYLYRHRLGFKAQDATLGEPVLPEGEAKEDPYFGHVVIYRDELLVSIPVVKAGDTITLEVRYQGCADAGYCYPPQKRTVNVVNVQGSRSP